MYSKKTIKKFVDLFIPKEGTKDYRKITELLKKAASYQKLEWLYINRITLCIVVFISSIFIFTYLHKLTVDYIYEQPTSDYDILR